MGSRGSGIVGSSWPHSISGIGGIGEYGGLGGLYVRSDVEQSAYGEQDLQNLQDDTANVLKEITNQGANQDGFTSSLSPRAPELQHGVKEQGFSEYDTDELQEPIDENNVDRATIEKGSNEGAQKARHPHKKDYANKKRTVGAKRRKKTSFRKQKLHKNIAASRNSIEANVDAKNETAGKNESADSAKADSEATPANNESITAGSKEAVETSPEIKTPGDVSDSQNVTAASNVTPSTRDKVDPYSSIGSDVSSMETASNMKISNMEHGNEAAQTRSSAPGQQKETDTQEHKDKSTSEADNILSKIKEGVAVKKHMTKEEMNSLESPVHALVKSIFHKAAKNVMKDFTKSSGLQNIAKMLVKAAVHNAMLGRPSAEKALELAEKAKKQSKKAKKKKTKKANTRSLKKKLDETKLVKDDLMAIGGHKVAKTQGKSKKKATKKD